MRIYITDKDETRNITLKEWDNEYNEWANGGADIFSDLAADDLRREYPRADYDTDAACAMTDAEYRETVEWWEDECGKYNSRDPYSWLVEQGDADAEYAKNHEMILFAD